MAQANDDFTTGSTVNLTSHTPTGTGAGTSWFVSISGGQINDVITANNAQDATGGNGNRYTMSDDLGTDQLQVQADITASGANFLFPGVQAQMPASAGTTGIEFTYQFSGASTGQWEISDGTSSSTLTENWPGGTVTMKLVMANGVASGYVNGVLKVQLTTSAKAGNHRCGIIAGNFTGGANRITIDNYQSTSITTTTQTITGKANISATTSKTQSGKARITATTTKTQSGVTRIQLVTSQTQTGKSRITATTSQTTSGKARLTATTTQTQQGKARITQTTSKTLTGVARITATTSQTITGKASISSSTVTTTKTISGVARITNTSTKTQTGVARIQITSTKTQSGVSRITQVTNKTQTGKTRITASTQKTQTGVARIQVTSTQTQTGKGRIALVTPKTITGVSRITATTSQTITGKANILNTASPSYAKNAPLYFEFAQGLSMMLGQPKVPTWNTAGRPTGVTGLIGFNTETSKLEIYDGSAWLSVLLS